MIELVLVIVLLGILAAVAVPRFIDLEREARVAVIENLTGTFSSQQATIRAAASIPGRLLEVDGSDQVWLDMNGNGSIDGDASNDQLSINGRDGADILLMSKSNPNPDNYQLHKLVDLSPNLVIELGPQRHQAYIGFDFDGDGDVKSHNCRVYYDQNRFRNRTDGC